MIHKACMPVYMNSGKIVAGGRDGTGGESKVLQEVLADLKRTKRYSSAQIDENISALIVYTESKYYIKATQKVKLKRVA